MRLSLPKRLILYYVCGHGLLDADIMEVCYGMTSIVMSQLTSTTPGNVKSFTITMIQSIFLLQSPTRHRHAECHLRIQAMLSNFFESLQKRPCWQSYKVISHYYIISMGSIFSPYNFKWICCISLSRGLRIDALHSICDITLIFFPPQERCFGSTQRRKEFD